MKCKEDYGESKPHLATTCNKFSKKIGDREHIETPFSHRGMEMVRIPI
jgi:hypothetical protein